VNDDCIESAVAALIADLEEMAFRAVQSGRDDVAENAARKLAAARVEFADVIGCCD